MGDSLLRGIQNMDLSASGSSSQIAENDNDDENPYLDELPPNMHHNVIPKKYQSTVFEILRCAVCLEVPKVLPNLQIKTCENGHHFCMFCIKKLKTCAICRGRIFSGRNFVVEELITKLGIPLGIQKIPLLPTQEPESSPKGNFFCPHGCLIPIPSIRMLPHLREKHSECLCDQLRTNPYTGWFQINFSVEPAPGARFVRSFHVSDMAMLTIVIIFPDKDGKSKLRFWVQSLSKETTLKYRLILGGFCYMEIPVLTYKEAEVKSNHKESLVPVDGNNKTPMLITLVVHKGSDSLPAMFPLPTAPTDVDNNVTFASNRKQRRNARRNMRKRRNVKRIKALREEANNATESTTGSNTRMFYF